MTALWDDDTGAHVFPWHAVMVEGGGGLAVLQTPPALQPGASAEEGLWECRLRNTEEMDVGIVPGAGP